jgi:hypothetical protein
MRWQARDVSLRYANAMCKLASVAHSSVSCCWRNSPCALLLLLQWPLLPAHVLSQPAAHQRGQPRADRGGVWPPAQHCAPGTLRPQAIRTPCWRYQSWWGGWRGGVARRSCMEDAVRGALGSLVRLCWYFATYSCVVACSGRNYARLHI